MNLLFCFKVEEDIGQIVVKCGPDLQSHVLYDSCNAEMTSDRLIIRRVFFDTLAIIFLTYGISARHVMIPYFKICPLLYKMEDNSHAN